MTDAGRRDAEADPVRRRARVACSMSRSTRSFWYRATQYRETPAVRSRESRTLAMLTRLSDAPPASGTSTSTSRSTSQTPPSRRTIDVGRQTSADPSHQSTGTSPNERSHVLVRSAWCNSSRGRAASSDQPAGNVYVAIGTFAEMWRRRVCEIDAVAGAGVQYAPDLSETGYCGRHMSAPYLCFASQGQGAALRVTRALVSWPLPRSAKRTFVGALRARSRAEFGGCPGSTDAHHAGIPEVVAGGCPVGTFVHLASRIRPRQRTLPRPALTRPDRARKADGAQRSMPPPTRIAFWLESVQRDAASESRGSGWTAGRQPGKAVTCHHRRPDRGGQTKHVRRGRHRSAPRRSSV